MPKIDYAMFVKIVAVVFSTSAVTAFVFAMLRVLIPELFYLEEPTGTTLVLHYFLCALMLCTSVLGVVNSAVVVLRPAARNSGPRVTAWLLLDSVFETARVLHLFVSEVLMRSRGPAQVYDLVLGAVQYLIDSLLYCQVILKKQ